MYTYYSSGVTELLGGGLHSLSALLVLHLFQNEPLCRSLFISQDNRHPVGFWGFCQYLKILLKECLLACRGCNSVFILKKCEGKTVNHLTINYYWYTKTFLWCPVSKKAPGTVNYFFIWYLIYIYHWYFYFTASSCSAVAEFMYAKRLIWSPM